MSLKDKKAPSAGAKAPNKARKAYEEAVLRAFRTYMETKEKAEITYKKALERVINERVKREADIKYQETLAQARKVRDEIMDEAEKVFRDATSK